jgi:drug/metabolite transporter (DMT)-like permease
MRNPSGFLFALVGFALLSCGDALIKTIGSGWPAPAIACLRFTIAIPMLAMVVAGTQGRQGFHITRPWIHFGRGLTLGVSSTLFFLSIFLMPLSEATAILFLNPIFAAILSMLVFGEKMRAKAWLMTGGALVGVALVLRPNVAELGLAAFMPVGTAFLFAVLMILNRMAAGTGSGIALQWIAAMFAAPVLAIVAFAGNVSGLPALSVHMPAASVVLICAIVAVSASISHWLIFQSTLRASAADASQAVYVQLPVALALDALVFGKLPDTMAFAGVALIVAAGLGMWFEQRNTARRA